MKHLLLCILPFLLYARSADTCYSVQVKSFYLKNNSSYDFNRYGYPQSCKLMKLSSMYAVRCGCYQNISSAKNALDRLSERYYDAIIVNTYSYRFGNNEHSTENFRDPIPKRKIYQQESSSNDSFNKRYNAIDLDEREEREEREEEDGYREESSFDNDYDSVNDLSEYGYE